MAYIVRKTGGTSRLAVSASASQFPLDIPKHEAGDLLLLFFSGSTSGSITSFTGTGWTLGQAITGNGSIANYAWKIAASNAEASPSIVNSATTAVISYSCFTIKGFDAVTPIRSSYAYVAPTRSGAQWAALTSFSSLSKGDIAFDYCVKRASSSYAPRPFAPSHVSEEKHGSIEGIGSVTGTNAHSACVFIDNIQADGERNAPSVYDISVSAADGTQAAIGIAIATSSSSIKGCRGTTDFALSAVSCNASTSSMPSTSRRLTNATLTLPASIFGYSTSVSSSVSITNNSDSAACALPILPTTLQILTSSVSPVWSVRSFSLTNPSTASTVQSIDISTSILAIPFDRTYLYGGSRDQFRDYSVFLHDTNSKVAAFNMSEPVSSDISAYISGAYNGRKGFAQRDRLFVLQKGMQDYEESGFDWTNVSGISVGILDAYSDGTNPETFAICGAFVGTYFNMFGGSSAAPLGVNCINDRMGKGHFAAASLLERNLTIRTGLGIGDGSHLTYADLSDVMIDFCSLSTTRQNASIGRSKEIRFKTSSSDTLLLKNLTIKNYATSYPTNYGKIVFDSACAVPALMNTEGMSVAGCSMDVQSANINLNGVAFCGAALVSGTGGQFTKCSFITGKGSSALSLSAGSLVKDCAFVKGDESYAITISAAGTYNIEGCVFKGYANIIHVTATSGTVYINTLSGDQAISVVSDGATVVTNATATPGVIEMNAISGSRVYIKNLSDNSVVMNEVPTGGSVNIDTAINNGGSIVPLLVRVVKEGYLPVEKTVYYRPGVGVDIPMVQSVDTIYNAIGKPLGTSFPMTVSGTSIVVSASTTAKDLYAFSAQQQLSSTGIVSQFNMMSAFDEFNFQLNGFKIKSSIAGASVTNGYIYTSDGSTPLDTTGQSIFLQGGKAYASEMTDQWDSIIENGMTAREIMRVNTAVIVGSATGLEGGAQDFKSLDGTKTRLSSTYSAGTRTKGTVDGS